MSAAEKMDEPSEPLVKLADVQKELNVSRITLFRWIKAGKLEAVRTPSGHWRVRRSVLDAMKEG